MKRLLVMVVYISALVILWFLITSPFKEDEKPFTPPGLTGPLQPR